MNRCQNVCFRSPGSLHAMARPSHRPVHTRHHLSRRCGAAFIGCSTASSAPSPCSMCMMHASRRPCMSRHSPTEVARGSDAANVWICGGTSVYRESFPIAQEFWATLVHADPCCKMVDRTCLGRWRESQLCVSPLRMLTVMSTSPTTGSNIFQWRTSELV